MTSGETYVEIDVEARRSAISAWIKETVRPVEHTLEGDHDSGVGFTDAKTGAGKSEFEIREYQLDAWAAIWDARRAGANRGLVHLATGLGKTSVGVFDTIKFRDEFRAKNGREPKILFAVHQNDILEQAAERFQAFIPEATIGFYNGDSKNLSGDITFATLQSLHSNLDSFDPLTFDYIINDEVHHAKARTFEEVITHFKPEFRLGLTATPNRADDKDIRELYGDELYSKSLAEALSEGWLASPDYHIVFDDAVKQAMQSGFQMSTLAALQELFNVQSRNEVIADNIKEEMAKIGLRFGDVKTIVFCQNIEHAEEMAKLLGGKAYHSEVDQAARRRDFDDFKNGDLQVITTRDMFNEGVDIPDARLLVFLRSTSSQTVFEQQLGRGLRKAENKDRVSILDFVANVERIVMVQELAQVVAGRSKAVDSASDSDNNGSISDSANNDRTGFAIHTNHGDFDFDKMTVDLLQKFYEFRERIDGRIDWSTYSDAALFELARVRSPDSALTIADMKRLNKSNLFPSWNYIATRFGTVKDFQRASGFEVTDRPDWKNWTKDEIITLAKELSPDKPLSRSALEKLSGDGIFMSATPLANRFGSLYEFQKQCGFDTVRDQNRWKGATEEEIVAQAQALSPEMPLTATRVQQLSKAGEFPSMGIVSSRFGGLRNLNFKLGHRAAPRTNWDELPDEAVIALIKDISPDKHLSSVEIDGFSKQGTLPSRGYLESRFGTLRELYIACGYPEEGMRKRIDWSHLTRDSLIELVRTVSPDEPMTDHKLNEMSKQGLLPNKKIVKKLVGSLVELQKATGFSPSIGVKVDLTAEDIIAMAREVSPDQRMKIADIDALFKAGKFPSRDVIRNRFGSMKSFHAAVWDSAQA